jgi:hypothetical protein
MINQVVPAAVLATMVVAEDDRTPIQGGDMDPVVNGTFREDGGDGARVSIEVSTSMFEPEPVAANRPVYHCRTGYCRIGMHLV